MQGTGSLAPLALHAESSEKPLIYPMLKGSPLLPISSHAWIKFTQAVPQLCCIKHRVSAKSPPSLPTAPWSRFFPMMLQALPTSDAARFN